MNAMEQNSAINPNPVLSVTKDGTVLYSNEAGKPLLHEWDVVVGEKLPSYIGDFVQRVISRNSPEKIEVKVGNKVFLVIFSPLPELECVNISGFDISDQKELEGKLRESENKYRNIVKTSVEGIWIFNEVSETTYVNEKMAEMLRYNREEMIGRFIWDFAYEEDKGVFQVKLANRKQGIDEIYELKLPRKDGSPLWVSVSAKGFFDDSGKFVGSVGMFTDITERKRAEEEVKSANIMLQLIMNNIPQGIFWKDRNYRYMGCNNVFAKATGVEFPENIVGKTDYDLPWSPEQTECFHEYDRRIMENDIPEFHIIELQWGADGKLAWVETNKLPLHDAKGGVIGILGTYEDISERKQVEEALRLSNLRNRTLIEASLDPLVIIGNDGNVTDVNKATEQATGYSRNDLIGTYFAQYLTEPDHAISAFIYVNTHGELRDCALEIKHRDGHRTPVLCNASVYRDENGKVIGVFVAARDITERKQAEEALKESRDILEDKVKERTAELEEAYNSLKESEKGLAEAQQMAHIGNWVWDIKTDSAYWSDEMYRIFGRDPQKLAPPYKEYLSYIHPDDRDNAKIIHTEALNGKPFNMDRRIVRDNGEVHLIHMHTKIIFDDNNIPIKLKGTIQDITERMKAEEKIRNLANIVESSKDAIGAISLDGVIASWNKGAEQVYGYSSEEILGKHISILAPSHLDKETMKLIELIKQGKGIHVYETSRLRKDGKKIYVSVIYSPVFDTNGNLTAISIIGRDITERKKAEEALRNLEIARKKEIHHRIKNNLQVISSLLDLQAEKFRNRDCVEDSEVLKAFRESQDRVTSIALIHEELHEGRGNDTLNFSPYLERLVNNLFQTYRLGNTNTSLSIELEEDVFFDMDTAVPLGIIINELVSNSLKYAFQGKEKGLILIKLRSEKPIKYSDNKSKSENEGFDYTNFILTVSDNGIGIPVFNSEDSDSLGLQLVAILVDQLDGELELKRDNGTEFNIRFKVSD